MNAVDDRLPGLGTAREEMMRVHAALEAAHTAVFLRDEPEAVLHLIDQAVPAPPLDELWSRVFLDENLPMTRSVLDGVATDDAEPASGEAGRVYTGFTGVMSDLGRVLSFPLRSGGRVVGAVAAEGCGGAARIGDLEQLERRLAPQLDALGGYLAEQESQLLAVIAEKVFGLRDAPGEIRHATGDEPGPSEPEIRAAISCGTFWWRLRDSVLHLDGIAVGGPEQLHTRGYTGNPMPLLSASTPPTTRSRAAA